MTGSIILHPIEHTSLGGTRLSATLNIHGSLKKWHQYIEIEGPLPEGFSPVHTGDVWATYFIFKMMEFGGEFSIEGNMSASLVANLDRFVEAWCCWRPELFRRVCLVPQNAMDDSEVSINSDSLACFSGGLDACFTLYRHRKGLAGAQNLDIKACLFVHGADIRIDHESEFRQSLGPCMELVSDLAVPQLFVVRTNFREMRCPYGTAFLSLLAACMRAVGRDYGNLVLGSDLPFNFFGCPWGSNPVSNHYLSSNNKRLVTDGLGYGRTAKAALVSEWPLALDRLRVCFSDSMPGGNCGKCSKCRRTYMNFLSAGSEAPRCMPPIPENCDISDIDLNSQLEPYYARDILQYADAHGRSEFDWVVRLRSRLAAIEREGAPQKKKRRGMIGRLIRHFERRRAGR
jgi:hypothetical protein